MPTTLNKVVTRKCREEIRDRSKFRNIIISLHPGKDGDDSIGFRLQGTRATEYLPVKYARELAIRLRVNKEKHEKTAARGEKYKATRGKL